MTNRIQIALPILTLLACEASEPVESDTTPVESEWSSESQTNDEDDHSEEEPSDHDSSEDPTEEPTDEPEDTEQPWEPVEGDWTTVDEYMSHDGCDMEEWVIEGPGGNIEIALDGDQSFQMTHGEGTDQCDYDRDSRTFECDIRMDEDTTPNDDYGLNATLILELKPRGSFNGDAEFQMTTDVNVECEGSGCWLVSLSTSSFPCEMTVQTIAKAN